MRPWPVLMHNGGVKTSSLLLFSLLGATDALASQDNKGMERALLVYNKLAKSREPKERARAVEELGEATSENHDRITVRLTLDQLRREIARGGRGGKSEEKVSGLVLETCLETLQRMTAAGALRTLAMAAGSRAEHVRVRMYATWALAERGELSLIEALVDDKAVGVRIAAVDALVERGDKVSTDTFLRILREPGRTWEQKLSALKGLAKVGDDKVIHVLIEGLEKCRDDEGRLKDRYVETLKLLVGVNLDSDDPNAWKAAWAAHRKGAAIPAGSTVAIPTEFYGLRTRSTRIVFVLDRTGSMEAPGSEAPRTVMDPPPEASVNLKRSPREAAAWRQVKKIVGEWRTRKVRTRMDAAKKELISTVYALSPRVHFNVLWYEGTPSPWKEELVPATWQNKLDCLLQTQKLFPSGTTNIWDALETAFKMRPDVRRRSRIRIDRAANYATAVDGADTFFVMTDGRPNAGRLPEPDSILDEIRKINRLRRITFHTICVGDLIEKLPADSPENPDPVFVRRMAELTHGEFTHIRK